MVSWWSDGLVSGFVPDNNAPEEALPALGYSIYRLAVPGSVDTQAITRLQYPVPGQYFRETIDAVARINISSGEFLAIYFAGLSPGASMFVTDSNNFPAGKVPTPQEIISLGDSKVTTVRADLSGQSVVAGNNEFVISGFYPQPGRKYWVLVCPTQFDTDSTPSIANDRLIGDGTLGSYNTLGRAISMWSNRRPDPPTITSPVTGAVYSAGAQFSLSFVGNDPDAVGGGSSQVYTDIAGVQVQYAPMPTADNPNPTWTDLPIGTTNPTGPVLPGAGWWIDQTTKSSPVSAGTNGAYMLWAAGSIPVKASSVPSVPGAAILSSGTWQIRMRTFDYGHAFPRWARPLAAPNGNYTPDTFPETNRSDWSTPVKVTVSAQVPAPLPISPNNNTAIPISAAVTLSWQYRNTYTPPFGQARREVQIRKAGEPDWFLLTDTLSPAQTYTITATPEPDVPPGTFKEYETDGGFESGVGGWTATAANSSMSSELYSGAHSGSKVMVSRGTGKYIGATKVYSLLQEKNFIWSGWTLEGPNSTGFSYAYVWQGPGGEVLLQNSIDVPRGAGWIQTIRNLVKPDGATKLTLAVTPQFKSGFTGSTNGDGFDDFSLLAENLPQENNAYTLVKSTQYEWRVRTTDTSGAVSDYSPVARFWMVPDPATGVLKPIPSSTVKAATLGCGKHEVHVYRRGGRDHVGKITDIVSLDWSRLRDDISDSRIVISGWGPDCGNLLSRLQTWAYEIVIFRKNGYTTERVWEGPITLLTYEANKVTIQAKDVMAYAYRRIIKQALNDSSNGDTVTSRAARILQNVFAPEDPNVLSYMSILSDSNDAKQYRNLPAFTRTAFEEVDDMAANSGLDYTAVGRSILLWSTKHRIGTLPEFRDEHLGSPPIVSEYGMQAANFYSVGDGNGVHGDANRLDVSGNDPIYGLIEMLSSTWATDSADDTGTYTQTGLATVIKSFEGSAERSIADRYPPPVVVRVPDNTTLSPDVPLSIQNLVPGVVIPLRSNSTLRAVADNQKLDSIKVTETDKGETITVVMSPFTREDVSTDDGTV